MKTINLKKYYYPICRKEALVELPDEVADAIAEAARALMMERLRETLATLTPRQASCLFARFWEDKPFKEIAEAEGFTTSAAIVMVRTTLIKLQKYFISAAGWSLQRRSRYAPEHHRPSGTEKRQARKSPERNPAA